MLNFLCFFVLFESCHKKSCLRGFQPGKTQTSLLTTETSYRLEILNIETRGIILSRQRKTKALIRLRRLICAFVVRIWHKQVFSWHGSFNAVKTDTKLTLHHMGKIFIIYLTKIKFKIWKVTFFKSFLPLKCFGMDFRFSRNRQFTMCALRWDRV